MTRFLNAREWLEHERLTGLPTADLAADALAVMDERDALSEGDELLLDQINQATGDVIENSDQIVDCFKFRDAVLNVLVEAGVSDGDPLTAAQAAGLLRMFLPAD